MDEVIKHGLTNFWRFLHLIKLQIVNIETIIQAMTTSLHFWNGKILIIKVIVVVINTHTKTIDGQIKRIVG